MNLAKNHLQMVKSLAAITLYKKRLLFLFLFSDTHTHPCPVYCLLEIFQLSYLHCCIFFSGFTALHSAVFKNSVQIVNYLVSLGANVNVQVRSFLLTNLI